MLLFLFDDWPRTPGTCIGSEMVLLGELIWEGRVKDRKVVVFLLPLIGGWRREVKFIVFFVVVTAIEFTFERISFSITTSRRQGSR
jgi:hypothetical protein